MPDEEKDIGGGIDPRVQEAADRLRQAYADLEKAQDPLVKKAERENVMQELKRATATTLTVEFERLKGSKKPGKN